MRATDNSVQLSEVQSVTGMTIFRAHRDNSVKQRKNSVTLRFRPLLHSSRYDTRFLLSSPCYDEKVRIYEKSVCVSFESVVPLKLRVESGTTDYRCVCVIPATFSAFATWVTRRPWYRAALRSRSVGGVALVPDTAVAPYGVPAWNIAGSP